VIKVSIITVVYNNAEFILDCINSVKSQDYLNIEHIVIDGNSTDGTVDLIKNNLDSISLFISEEDKGLYDAMNKGIALATGDIIGILNSDDLYYDNNVITKIAQCFINDPKIDVLYGDLVYVEQKDISKIVRMWKSNFYYPNYFENGNVPAHPTLFLKKYIYNSLSNFNLDYKLASDYEFMLRLFKKFNFNKFYLESIFVKMRLGGVTSKNISNRINQNLEILKAWKENDFIIPLYFFPLRFFKKLTQFFK
jgi:glycosyltransferase involved in cell wall biosynthesis